MKPAGFPYEEWPQDLKDEYAYNPSAARKLLAVAGFPMDLRQTSSRTIPGTWRYWKS